MILGFMDPLLVEASVLCVRQMRAVLFLPCFKDLYYSIESQQWQTLSSMWGNEFLND